MMFSPSSCQFYEGFNIPSDCVVVARAAYDQALACLAVGGFLTADATGQPVTNYPAPTLAAVQATQIAQLSMAYAVAITQPVSFTPSSGTAGVFQADPTSVDNLQKMLEAFRGAQQVPQGFYWLDASNNQVPFTYTDMQGLAAAIGAHAFTQFANLQVKKAAVRAAADIPTVQGISF